MSLRSVRHGTHEVEAPGTPLEPVRPLGAVVVSGAPE